MRDEQNGRSSSRSSHREQGDTEASGEPRGQTQALMRGLRILRILVEADGPMSATGIAQRCGLHQSSVSRILATLAEGGYVRKETYRSFVPDYGVLALATSAWAHFTLMDRPRRVLQEAADRLPGLAVSLCMLWRRQLIYFLRSTAGHEPVLFEGDGYPVHMSAPGMRFVADLPEDEARAVLARSRRRFGWPRPVATVAADEADAVARARAMVEHDCLVAEEWGAPGHVSAAVLLRPHDGHPLALAVNGPRTAVPPGGLPLLLHELRRDVEAVLAAGKHPRERREEGREEGREEERREEERSEEKRREEERREGRAERGGR